MKTKVDDGPPIDLPDGFTLEDAREAVSTGPIAEQTRKAKRLLRERTNEGDFIYTPADVFSRVALPHDIFDGLVLRLRGVTAWKENHDQHSAQRDTDQDHRDRPEAVRADDTHRRDGGQPGPAPGAPEEQRQGPARDQQGPARPWEDGRGSGRRGLRATRRATEQHIALARAGYNPLTSMHFKDLPRSVRVELYETYWRRP